MLGKNIVLLAFLCTVAAAKRQIRGSLLFLDKAKVLRQESGVNVASGTAAEPGQSLDHHLGKQLTSDNAPAYSNEDAKPSPQIDSHENWSSESNAPSQPADSMNGSPGNPSMNVPYPSFISPDPLNFPAAGKTLLFDPILGNTEPSVLTPDLISNNPLDAGDSLISNQPLEPFAGTFSYSNQPLIPLEPNPIQERPGEHSSDSDRPLTYTKSFTEVLENSNQPNIPSRSPPSDPSFSEGYAQKVYPQSEIVGEVLSLSNTGDLEASTSQSGESTKSFEIHSTTPLNKSTKPKFTSSKRPVTSRRTTTRPTAKPSITKKTKPTTIKTIRPKRSTTVRHRTTKPNMTDYSSKKTPKVLIFSPLITRKPAVTTQKVNKTTTQPGPCAQPVPWPLKGQGNPPIVSQNCEKYPEMYRNEMDTCTKENGFTDTNTKLYIPFCCRKWKKLGCFERSLNK